MAKRKPTPADETPPAAEYTVLARRYRPQQFDTIIGQEPVARALVNALEGNRVAHAYLFTGARGVGKTSTARILAKALNCVRGPTAHPCDECENCRSIAVGENDDVLEIDGASNRGIDEIRELRRNVTTRPGRSRYKVYIIDEVHMLTKEAFNALLKTLEEPPPHVKFIFATTEVQKIPVTILSRCQRFDFGGIPARRIVEHLKAVAASEGVQADADALEWVARRAGGSMRDAQSLLDQLLAFGGAAGGGTLTLDQVHRLLGTAADDRVVALASAVLAHDVKQALDLLAAAADAGVQLGELLDQLIDYWRDLLVVNCAGLEGRDLSVTARHREALGKQAQALSADTILAGLDVLATTKARLRGSSHGRVLVEMALVRLGRLEDLVSLTQVAQWLNGAAPAPKGASPPAAVNAPTPASPPAATGGLSPPTPRVAAAEEGPLELTPETLPDVWRRVLAQVGPMLAGHLDKAAAPQPSGPGVLVLQFPSHYNADREYLQEPSRVSRVEEALRKVTGQTWALRYEALPGESPAPPTAPAAEADAPPSRYRRQRAEAAQLPLVKRAMEQLDAQIVHVDEGFGAAPAAPPGRTPDTDPEEP